jgi:hypothetical protein
METKRLIDKHLAEQEAKAPISPLVKLTEIRREIAWRRDNYPKWVAKGTMKQATASRKIQVMEAIEADYAAQVEAE